jgi:hypothetical protein
MSRGVDRRTWLSGLGIGAAVGLSRSVKAEGESQPATGTRGALALDDFRPRSMLVVPDRPHREPGGCSAR